MLFMNLYLPKGTVVTTGVKGLWMACSDLQCALKLLCIMFVLRCFIS